MKRLAIAGTLSLSLVVSLAARAGAQSVIYVDADAAGSDNGSSWADAYVDLQDALAAPTSGDEIWVAEGTYRPTDGSDRTISFALAEGVALYGGFAGTESARDERDWVAHGTILSGDIGFPRIAVDNSYHVVKCMPDARLDGFTIAGGYADGGGLYDDKGGGALNIMAAGLEIANCTFEKNWADADGGGIFTADAPDLAITDCTFRENRCMWSGGGMYTANSSLTVTGCTFDRNEAGFGAGMHHYDSVTGTVTGCLFTGNAATADGAGMYNDAYSSPELVDCIFTGGRAFMGAGVRNYGWSSPTLIGCTFSDNAADTGGAIVNGENSDTFATQCVFYRNSGGAVHNDKSSPIFTQCTFAANTPSAGGDAGAMTNVWTASPVLVNSVLWGNSVSAGTEVMDDATSATTATYTCVQGGWPGTGNIGELPAHDPLFADIAGGDLHLRPCSPCIDSGDGDAAPATDLDGNPRHDDPGIPNTGVGAITYADMGTYEFQGDSRGEPVTPFAGGCHASRQTGAVSLAGLALCLLVPCCALRRRKLPRRTRHD